MQRTTPSPRTTLASRLAPHEQNSPACTQGWLGAAERGFLLHTWRKIPRRVNHHLHQEHCSVCLPVFVGSGPLFLLIFCLPSRRPNYWIHGLNSAHRPSTLPGRWRRRKGEDTQGIEAHEARVRDATLGEPWPGSRRLPRSHGTDACIWNGGPFAIPLGLFRRSQSCF